jgi:ABC-type transport system involved in cytochrome bd biosynthesis fused ATPase/permease subunit
VIERAILGLAERATAAGARVDAARAALSGSNEVLGALLVVAVVALAPRYGIVLGDGMLVAFCAVLFMAYRPLRELGDARGACLRGAVALEALERVKREGRQPPPARQSESQPFHLAPLELAGLGAERGGPRTSARIEPGEVACVVGRTGSGKTTLLRILLGLEPAVGRLRYAGIDISDSPVGPLARPFAWVPQDAPLVTGTLLFNVALLGGSRGAARDALETIGAEGLLERLGDTLIGPGARPLSGGERRQVAIARALCSGLPVLLLDEPSEGLDATARRQVLKALERLRGRRSVIVVTHRRELAACADRIIRLGVEEELDAPQKEVDAPETGRLICAAR